jgi:SH3-like domain-containing protein
MKRSLYNPTWEEKQVIPKVPKISDNTRKGFRNSLELNVSWTSKVGWFWIILGVIEIGGISQSYSSSQGLSRFASVRSRLVNVHVGPGLQYPVNWQLIQLGLPVEIVGEFENWRQIRDVLGAKGWVHKNLLCGKRTIYVLQERVPIHVSPDPQSPAVAYLQKGVIGQILDLYGEWCLIRVSHSRLGLYKGWILRQKVFGLSPLETRF